MKKFLLGLTIALVAIATFASNVSDPALIPVPRQIKVSDGVFTLNPSARICVTDSARPTAEYLAAQLRRVTGYPLRIRTAPPGNGDILISITGTNTVSDAEAYELTVTPETIAINASTAVGAFYGVQSLLQLFPPAVFGKTTQRTNWTVKCVKIEDAPRFPWRGLLLDVSRHFLTVDEVKEFIDLMALHKLNTLHLHLTDDQGWRLEIKKYPELTRVGSIRKESPKPGDRKSGDGTSYGPFFYTQKQIRDLVAYASVRHIEIVPEIDMPGHVLGLLATHPDLSCRGVSLEVRTRWGIADDVLCIGNTNSLSVMEDILNEVVQLFPSHYIHIGGDECPRVRWQECPKCQGLMTQQGMTNAAQLQTWFNHQIGDFLLKHDRRMIGWDEVLEGGLTPGELVMSWRNMNGGIEAAKQGHDVIMTPASYCYFNYGQGKGPNEPEVIGGFVPLEKAYAFEPVPATIPVEDRNHVIGVQGALWSEYLWTARQFEYSGFPRICALAEVAWSPETGRNFNDFRSRLGVHLQRLDELDVNYRHLDPLPTVAGIDSQTSH